MSILVGFFRVALGFGIFFLGLRVTSYGLSGFFGARLRVLLGCVTRTSFSCLFSGMLAASLLQSSSVVNVLILTLVHSKVITLPQALAMVLGSNIGTTVTTQLVSFSLGALSLPLLFFGFFLSWSKHSAISSGGYAFFGLGALFFGIDYLKDALTSLLFLGQAPIFFQLLSKHILSAVLFGTLLTGLIQSSSATTGLAIAFVQGGVLSLEGAFAMTLGANIGTVVTTLLGSVGLSKEAKITALADLLFNVLGVLLLLPFFHPFMYLVRFFGTDEGRQIANAHTLFNGLTAFLVVPFLNKFTCLAMFLAGFPAKKR